MNDDNARKVESIEDRPLGVRVHVATHDLKCGCDYIRINGAWSRRKVCKRHRKDLEVIW